MNMYDNAQNKFSVLSRGKANFKNANDTEILNPL